MEEIKSGTWRLSNRKAVLSPDATDQSVLCICDGQVEFIHIDVIFRCSMECTERMGLCRAF